MEVDEKMGIDVYEQIPVMESEKSFCLEKLRMETQRICLRYIRIRMQYRFSTVITV